VGQARGPAVFHAYDRLEDVLRFLIYLPFMALFGAYSIVVLIPNLVNGFGDGLAEPVGIRLGKHPYRTRALWHGSKFWSGVYERTWERSATVFMVTIGRALVLHGELHGHSADGPLIALVGCSTLWCVQWL